MISAMNKSWSTKQLPLKSSRRRSSIFDGLTGSFTSLKNLQKMCLRERAHAASFEPAIWLQLNKQSWVLWKVLTSGVDLQRQQLLMISKLREKLKVPPRPFPSEEQSHYNHSGQLQVFFTQLEPNVHGVW